MQIAYSIHRIMNPNDEILPSIVANDIQFDIEHILNITLANTVLTIFHLSQIFKFLTVIEEFGKIIDLSFEVIWKVFYFLIYY